MLLPKLTSTQQARSNFEGWKNHTIQVDHQLVGGVTNQSVHITGHSRVRLAPCELPHIVGEDASTVLGSRTLPSTFEAHLAKAC
jgi:hypothetical protein